MISKTNPLASESQISRKKLRLNYCADAFLRFVHEPGSVVHVFVKDVTSGRHRNYVGYYDTDHLKKLWQDVKQFCRSSYRNLLPPESGLAIVPGPDEKLLKPG